MASISKRTSESQSPKGTSKIEKEEIDPEEKEESEANAGIEEEADEIEAIGAIEETGEIAGKEEIGVMAIAEETETKITNLKKRKFMSIKPQGKLPPTKSKPNKKSLKKKKVLVL